MTKISIKHGDLLDETADVIVSTANPNLLMSGGVNGAILMRGGQAIQDELQAHLKRIGRKFVAPGTVVITNPGPLSCKYLLHAVSINAFYESSIELIADTIGNVLQAASDLTAMSIALPALATGYGPLCIEDFARGLRLGIENFASKEYLDSVAIRVVIWRPADVEIARKVFE